MPLAVETDTIRSRVATHQRENWVAIQWTKNPGRKSDQNRDQNWTKLPMQKYYKEVSNFEVQIPLQIWFRPGFRPDFRPDFLVY